VRAVDDLNADRLVLGAEIAARHGRRAEVVGDTGHRERHLQLRIRDAFAGCGIEGAVGAGQAAHHALPGRRATGARHAGRDMDAAHAADARRGIGAAERGLEQFGILDRLDRLLPGLQIDEIRAPVGRRGPFGRRLLQPVALLAVDLPEALQPQSAEIVGAGADVEIHLGVRVDTRI
jgi:hypothetical protein